MRNLHKIVLIKPLFALIAMSLITWSAVAQNVPSFGSAFFEGKAASISKQTISDENLDNIFRETIERSGNFTSRYTVNSAEALELGKRWLGNDQYIKVGKPDSGVFLSSDQKRRFRIDRNSLLGNHPPGKPHVHLEVVVPVTQIVLTNNHIFLVD